MVDFSNDLEQCVQALRSGGVIVYPTDTVWGIGCDATNAAAVDKIFALKQRPANKSMIVLVADEAQLAAYVPGQQAFSTATLPDPGRPTTVIYAAPMGIAANALAPDGSLGIRIVRDDFCAAMIRAFGKPVISTSANISGQATASFYREIHPDILSGADYVAHFRRDDETVHQPSRIVQVLENGSVNVLRP